MHRARLLFEVIEAIKSKCGAEFPIILRMSGSEKLQEEIQLKTCFN